MTRRRAALLGLLFVVVAALTFAGWTLYRGYANNTYRAIPASAWPAMNGAHLASAQSVEGRSCCEPVPGRLHATLVVPAEHPLDVITAGLVANGWTVRHCDWGLLIARNALRGTVALGKSDGTGATAVVDLEREKRAQELVLAKGCTTA